MNNTETIKTIKFLLSTKRFLTLNTFYDMKKKHWKGSRLDTCFSRSQVSPLNRGYIHYKRYTEELITGQRLTGETPFHSQIMVN